MYSDNSITELLNRIKWRVPSGEYASILNAENTVSSTQKSYQEANKIVTLANIHNSQPNIHITDEEFNTYLSYMDRTCVNKVLEDVFDLNSRAIRGFDYDLKISNNASIFDECLKLCMAVQVVELVISSTRLNTEESLLGLSYNKLKVELEGAVNDNGKVISVGLNYRYRQSINKVINILFPKSNKATIGAVNDW